MNKQYILIILELGCVLWLIISVQNYYRSKYILQAQNELPTEQYFYSEHTGFSFKAPITYTIASSALGIDLSSEDKKRNLNINTHEVYGDTSRDVLEELEFYSGNEVNVSSDTFYGFDRYEYLSGNRKGNLFYLKPLNDYLFIGIYGDDRTYKNDIDMIASTFTNHHEK